LARIRREKAPQPKIGRRSDKVEENEEEVLDEVVSDEAVVEELEESSDDVDVVNENSKVVVTKESRWKFNSKQVLIAFIAILAIIIAIVGTKLIKQQQEQTELRKASIYLDQSRKAEKSKEESKKQSIADSQSIEKSKSIEASVSKSESESVSVSESRSVSESISISESESVSASKSAEKVKQDVDLEALMKGNLSSIAGTWINSEGRSFEIHEDGWIEFDDETGSSNKLYIGKYAGYSSSTGVYQSEPVTSDDSHVGWTFVVYKEYASTGQPTVLLADNYKHGNYDGTEYYTRATNSSLVNIASSQSTTSSESTSSSKSTYTVQAGDYLRSIAKKTGYSADAIARANGHTAADYGNGWVIYPGEELKLP
jgi:epidermal growth factor receptor substrate 15